MKKQHLHRAAFAAALATALAILSPVALFAESDSSDIVIDEDSLFGDAEASDDAMFTEPIIESMTTTSGLESTLLSSEQVELGGRYAFSASSTWVWNDPESIIDEPRPDSDLASVQLGATLFFDARPTDDFRVLGKATISHPFDDQGDSRSFSEVIRVDELFSDFNWHDRVFLRGGKHTLNWGVGYFFSPADLLNVTEIDPEDPEADREGPVSLKAQVPINIHNLYLYFIANRIDSWDDVGIATKAEIVIGSAEVGIGALYQREVPPSAMLTFTAPVGDFDLFAEAVGRYGSDRTFIETSTSSPIGVTTATYDERLFAHITAGLSYRYSFVESDSSFSFMGQYLFNGEGYEDVSVLRENRNGIAALLGTGGITTADLLSAGRHYAAASAGLSGLVGGDVSFRTFWIHGFDDSSGMVTPSISVSPFDGMDFTLQASYRYGEEGDEYTPVGETLSANLSVRMGGGSF
jgi:hypothetical protein